MKFIQSTDLLQWADRQDAEGVLPLLLRKLIIASCGTFPNLTIPAGDSVYKPGIDGRSVTEQGGFYVPDGISIWEFGRGDDFKAKFQRDFKKRNGEFTDEEKAESSFIFVTPRRWVKEPMKDDLAKEMQEKTAWKSVKILDADDLETWLEQLPQVAVWLAAHLELYTANMESAEHYWERMANWGDSQVSPEFVIAGRNSPQQALLNFIDEKDGYLELQGTSRDETICFIIASYIAQGVDPLAAFFSRAIIVSDKTALKEVCAKHNNLIIIFDSGNDRSIDNLRLGKNKVLYPVSYKVKSNGLTIPIPKTEDFVKQLEDFGINHKQSYQIAKECGKSFSVLSRYFSKSPGRVNWNEGHDLTELIPLLLVGKFDTGKEGDRAVIEQLSGIAFESYLDKLKKWTLIFDKPVYQVANIWQAVSAHDLLFVLGRHITEEHLRRYEAVFFSVLGETDPALQLEPEMRIAAALFKKESPYSKRLKEGICLTLILFSLFGDNAGIQVSFDLEDRIAYMVRKLLMNKEISFWQSIESKLNLLAEAAPGAYLDSLEDLIKNFPDVITELFNDEKFNIFSRTYHAHILWSLEALAWDKAFLSRVSLLLARLVLLDKGSKTANRPINTLKYIFSVWLPQTYVPVNARRQVLSSMAKKNAEAAFVLIMELLPDGHDIGMYNYQPLWRMRDHYPTPVQWGEIRESVSFLSELLLKTAGSNPARWAKIVDHINHFHGEDRQRVILAFKSIDQFDGEVHELRSELQDFISRHKIYAGKDWAVPADDRKQLEEIYDRLTIRAIDKYAWYFNVDHIENRRTSNLPDEELREITLKKRKTAIKDILAEDGISGLIELAPHIKKPAVIGEVLALLDKDQGDLLFDYLENEQKNIQSFSMGYMNQAGETYGFEWIKALYERHSHRSIQQHVLFLTAFNSLPEVLDMIEGISDAFADLYWQWAFKGFGFVRYVDLERCVIALNQRGRYLTSINLMGTGRKEIPPKLVYETLDGLITNKPEEGVFLHWGAYGIGKLFKILDDAEYEGNMALLEWKYFEILEDGDDSGRGIKYIYPALTNNPEFFAQVVSWIYIPENRPAAEEVQHMEEGAVINRARSADKVLEAWDHVPGESDDRQIDFAVLKEWCTKAIAACKELDRTSKGYYKIGHLLGQLRDGNANWPQPEICELVEHLDNESCNEGFVNGVINGRGSRVRLGPVSDGSNEDSKSKYYLDMADRVSPDYPLVGTLLQKVAGSYKSFGRYMATQEAQRQLE